MSQAYKQSRRQGKRIGEHRLVMEAQCGRELGRLELVHHENLCPMDNRAENLKIVTPKEHAAIHLQKHPLTWRCEVCGTEFTPSPTKRGGGKRTCSKACRFILTSRTQRNPDGPRSKYRLSASPSEIARRMEGPHV